MTNFILNIENSFISKLLFIILLVLIIVYFYNSGTITGQYLKYKLDLKRQILLL